MIALNFRSQILHKDTVECTTKKRSLPTSDNGIPAKRQCPQMLTFKLSGCSKFFYDECLWASNQRDPKYLIKRKDHQPNTIFAFAVMCHSKEDEHQVGWIKESDKNTFLDFIKCSAQLDDLNVACNKLKVRPEHKTVELEIKVSNKS